MKIEKEKKLNTAYIQFRRGTVSKTKKLTSDLLVDYDKNGRILGIEVLSLTELAPSLKIISHSHGKSKSAA